MKRLTKEQFEQIRRWVGRNARPLEFARWQCQFENGDPQTVVQRLLSYQNPDGGFGHGLEPDSWNPNSSAYQTWYALSTLLACGQLNHPAAGDCLRYLDACQEATDDGWQFTIASNDHYPHAPWWHYDEKTNAAESFGLSLSLALFAALGAQGMPALAQKAQRILKTAIKELFVRENFGEMDVGAYLALAQMLAQLPFAVDHPDRVRRRVYELAIGHIETDPQNWRFYRPRPSAFIASAQSPLFAPCQTAVMQELDYLIDTLPQDDVWDIPWTWGGAYEPQFQIARNWWKAQKAMDHLAFLGAFDRLA